MNDLSEKFDKDIAPCDDCENESFCRHNKVACNDFRIFVFENILINPGDEVIIGYGKGKKIVPSCRTPLRKHYRKVFQEKDCGK